MEATVGQRKASGLMKVSRHSSVVRRLTVGVALLSLALLGTSMASMSMGPVNIPVANVASAMLDNVGIDAWQHTETEALVLEQLRLPRIVVGILVGMALGAAGATMQGLFRNPLADPGIIGVSMGGATGAVLAIALGLSGLFYMALPTFAFLGSLAAAFVVYSIGGVGGRFSMATIILAGVAVSSFLGAVISTIIVVEADEDSLRGILFWLAGSLDSRSWEHVGISAPLILGGAAVILVFSRDLNLLMLGDDDARSMGVRVGLLRPMLIGVASMITGVAVAVSGVVAFVGLVAPHMLRIIFGPDHRVLIPVSALGGAFFLVAADTIARTVIQPAEFQVGIVTAFVGAPFFIFLLIKNKRKSGVF